MNDDRRNWAIMIILFILLVSIFFMFGPTYYESLDNAGKRIFMLPVQIVIIAIGYYVGHWFLDRRGAKGGRDETINIGEIKEARNRESASDNDAGVVDIPPVPLGSNP